MKKICIFLLSFILLQQSIFAYAKETTTTESDYDWPKGPSISAASAIIMDASTGLIIYEKKTAKKQYPASVTKIMTTLLALEHCSLNELVTFSHNAVYSIERNSSHIGITEGEILTMEQCLYGIMLESANEVSNAVAEHIAGDLDSFAKMMNEKAVELGCENTNFVNAHGLFDNNHYTTAYDMALISKAALENDTFCKIISTKSNTIPPTNLQKETRYLNNHHQMLTGAKYPQYKYDDIIGGKTGYTQKARYSLATFAEKDGMRLICIIMKAESVNEQYEDTIKLLNFGFDNYHIYNLATDSSFGVLEDSPFFTRFNHLFSDTDSPIQVTQSGQVILPNTANYDNVVQKIDYTPVENLENGNKKIGSVSYTYGDKIVGESDILFSETALSDAIKLELPSQTQKILTAETVSKNIKPIIIGIILILIVLGFLFYYILVERPRVRRKKAFYEKRKRTKLSFDHNMIDFK